MTGAADRSGAPTAGRSLAAGLAIVFLLVLMPPAGASPAAAQSQPARIVVWLAGVNTRSDDGLFLPFQAALTAAGAAGGWAVPGATIFQRFSYAYPSLTYTCGDTWAASIGDQARRLEQQVADLAAAHPGAEIALIGHSQGGLIALAYLAMLKDGPRADWRAPLPGSGARISHVVTISAPLGGIPSTFVSLTDLVAQVGIESDCGEVVAEPRNTADMRAIYRSAGADRPRGAAASAAQIVAPESFPATGERYTNQQLALDASFATIGMLTIGNLADWVYQPCGPVAALVPPNLDTQWLRDQPAARIYGRAFLPIGAHPCTSLAHVPFNHTAGLTEPVVLAAVASFLAGDVPDQLAPAPAGG